MNSALDRDAVTNALPSQVAHGSSAVPGGRGSWDPSKNGKRRSPYLQDPRARVPSVRPSVVQNRSFSGYRLRSTSSQSRKAPSGGLNGTILTSKLPFV